MSCIGTGSSVIVSLAYFPLTASAGADKALARPARTAAMSPFQYGFRKVNQPLIWRLDARFSDKFRVIRFDAAGPVAPVGSTGRPTLLRFASPERYAKPRESPLWTTGTTSIETNRSGQFRLLSTGVRRRIHADTREIIFPCSGRGRTIAAPSPAKRLGFHLFFPFK